MKKGKIYILIISLLLIFNISINAQKDYIYDSVQKVYFYDNKENFIRKLNLIGFLEAYRNIPHKMSRQIKRSYRRNEFKRKYNDDELYLTFIIYLDSCGSIIDCKPAKNKFSSEKSAIFEKEVSAIILNSNWKIKNFIALPDTSILIKEISLSIDQLYLPKRELYKKKYPIALRYENEIFYYEGFENKCKSK
jgi:hypothetical protein